MEKTYKKQFPIKFKKNEREDILEFANKQTNFNDTIRYLIEKEIAENGIRNLQEYIPPVRDHNYFKTVSTKGNSSEVKTKEEESFKKVPSCYE